MNDDPLIPAPERCDGFQRQLSDHADSGAALPPELRAHLGVCDACARFAEQWLHGAPLAWARPLPAVADPRLRERILDAAERPDIIRFPAPAARATSWATWAGRAAACAALAGLSYWLLNPAASPVRDQPVAASEPTLTQNLARMEDKTRHEQEIVQTALVDGGRQVQGNVAWSVSALEL